MKASDAQVIEFNFGTSTATVVFADHHQFAVDDVVAYSTTPVTTRSW